ncbi:MAG TPA: DUF1992 domain-containing protein [Actinopolymorphaceae bacterium]
MSERKPPGMGFETWVDRQIREAQERGEFDNLPGAGKPIPGIDKPFDEMEWVAKWIRREGLSTEVLLPEPLQLRKAVQRLPETVRDLRSEREVRDVVDDLNHRIKSWLMLPREPGPSVVVVPVDPELIVAEWRKHREEIKARAAARARRAEETAEAPQLPRQRPWWRRLLRMR